MMLYKNAYKKLCSLSTILLLVFFLSADFYAAPGDLDSTFGSGGKVVTDISGVDLGNGLVLQPDGKLIVAGATNASTSPDFALARYNTDGSLDSTFGNGGRVTTDFFGFSDSVGAVIIQPDGKIVAAGRVSPVVSSGNFGLARYNSDGSLDSAFGSGGKVSTDFAGGFDVIAGLVLQADGKIVAAGQVSISGINDFGLARYNTNGTLDTTFGTGGKITTDFGNGDSALGVVLQPDGKIVAAGYTANANFSASDFALARYLGDSVVARRTPFDFDGDGKADVSVFRPSDGTWYLLQSQAGFSSTQFGSPEDKPVAADYDGDGKTDVAVFRPSNGTWYLLARPQVFPPCSSVNKAMFRWRAISTPTGEPTRLPSDLQTARGI